MKDLKKILNLEYAAIQGCYWMVYCVVLSFAAVFLQARGYSYSSIGMILAAGNICALVIQPAAASLADSARRLSLPGILALMLLPAVLAMAALLFLRERSLLMTLSYVVFLSFVFAMQPLCNSLCGYLERWGQHINFGAARGVGSLSFSLLAALLGFVCDMAGVLVLPAAGLAVSAVFLLLLAQLSRQNREYSEAVRVRPVPGVRGGFVSFIRANPRFGLLLFGTMLLFFPHNLVNNFPANIVENLGGNNSDMGVYTCIMALMELPAMFLFERLLRRWRCSTLLRLSALMFTVKEIMICLSGSLLMLNISNIFQALSFAVFIPASVHYAYQVTAPEDAVKGQAYFTTMLTAGAILASVTGGLLFDSIGTTPTLAAGAFISAVGTVCVMAGVVSTGRSSGIQSELGS